MSLPVFELSIHVGNMSLPNYASLVKLSESVTLKSHRILMLHTLAVSVVGRLHAQGIVEHIF